MADNPEPVVYIVDDDEAVRESLSILLDAYGISTEAYAAAAAFLEQADLSRRCCLVLDARLPGMDGLELLQRLSTDGRSIPCIMVTGHGDKDLFDEAARLGVMQCFRKPFNSGDLVSSIRCAISNECQGAG